jgi:hypothetical protein
MLKKLVEEADAEYLGERDGIVRFRDRETGRVLSYRRRRSHGNRLSGRVLLIHATMSA